MSRRPGKKSGPLQANGHIIQILAALDDRLDKGDRGELRAGGRSLHGSMIPAS